MDAPHVSGAIDILKKMQPNKRIHSNTSIIDVTETDFVNKPVGTGPFAVSSFTPGTALDLIRYDEYWDGAAKLEKARNSFNEDANARSLALESGGADVVFRPEVENLENLEAIEGVTVESTSTFRVHQMTMNLQRKPLQNINVRKAMDALINRDSIVDTILIGHAEVATGLTQVCSPKRPANGDSLVVHSCLTG